MDYMKLKAKRRKRKILLFIFLAVAVYFTALSCKVNLKDLISGFPTGVRFLGFMFPPDVNALTQMLKPAADTILYAFLATIFGSILSLAFGLAGASNISPGWLRHISRFILTTERALPEIIILLLLVAALGLGPFAGVIALSIGCIGMLGRLFADAIEEVNPRILESIDSVGANKFQVIAFGVIPEILPSIISNTIFRFEVNIRLSVLLGAVGAGGIGYELFYSFSILQYERATTAILVTLAMVFMAERFSEFLRKKIVPQTSLK